MRDIPQRLRDIQEAIERIEQFAGEDKETYSQQPLIQTWMVYHLQIIGEVARSLPPDFKVQHPEIPWQKIGGMRNILVHLYFEVDTEIVWSVIQNDLPALKQQIMTILNDLTGAS